jgi:NAD(P)-dependent dehydrogenase (short-subunit alcohol dehydrogenase family)
MRSLLRWQPFAPTVKLKIAGALTMSTITQPNTARLNSPQPEAAAARSHRSSYWSGKVVLITGSSSGLGRALAEEFARAGADVIVSARAAEALETVAVQLRQYGTQVLAIPADVTQQDQVDHLIEQAVKRFGRLDVLVNNVGRSARSAVLDVTPEDFQNLLDLNFLGAVRCTRAAAPHLIRSRGHLVNIGSLSGKSASRYVGAYAVTKFALAGYTQQLRLELAPQGVHVMLVSPGPIARDDSGQRYADQLEGLPARAGKPGAGVRIQPIRPEKLSQAILRACRHRKAELIYPGIARLFIAVIQIFPRLGDWLIRKMT